MVKFMCGLTFSYGAPNAVARTERALSAMRHRGPDESGKLEKAGAVLGHCRLSIIDLDGSSQPLCGPTGHILVFNGEVYNYKALRHELSRDWRFSTNGDGEVLLAGLLIKGADFLDQVDGMWAFAMWNPNEKNLLLGRDRFGKKPLYYSCSHDGRRMVAASELPLVHSLSGAEISEDEDSVADYFRYGFALPGRTLSAGINEVPPAHVLAWEPGIPPKLSRWWSAPLAGDFRGSRNDAKKLLLPAFERSVRNRLVADVEVGSFLSGGIDSSLVSIFAARHSTYRLRTFSIGFDEADYDETSYARHLASRLNSLHVERKVQRLDETELEDLLQFSFGQPFGDPSVLPTALVSSLAAEHVKVALSGDGADELFSGYQRYQAQVLLRWYSRLPMRFRRMLAQGVRRFPAGHMHHSRSLLKKAQMFVELSSRSVAGGYVAPRYFDDLGLSELLPGSEHKGHTPPGIPARAELDDLEIMMRQDALIYMPQDILAKVDRASMHHSLEVRAPFLGKDVVDLAMGLPGEWHRNLVSGKQLLREVFRDQIPPIILRRRKQGFAVPVSHWFSGLLGDRLLELLRMEPGPLNSGAVNAMLSAHRARTEDHGLRLWLIYAYLLWRNRR